MHAIVSSPVVAHRSTARRGSISPRRAHPRASVAAAASSKPAAASSKPAVVVLPGLGNCTEDYDAFAAELESLPGALAAMLSGASRKTLGVAYAGVEQRLKEAEEAGGALEVAAESGSAAVEPEDTGADDVDDESAYAAIIVSPGPGHPGGPRLPVERASRRGLPRAHAQPRDRVRRPRVF